MSEILRGGVVVRRALVVSCVLVAALAGLLWQVITC